MDYENLYKKALERARVWKEKSGMPADKQGILDDIFPELTGSEDEKIRKAMIALFKGQIPSTSKEDNKKFVAWLEKQGESYTKRDVDNAYLEGMAFAKDELEKQGKQKPQRMISAEAKEAMYNKPADTVEQKFKVKYAGSEYNVLEIKEIAGDTYYGIEDEPNHIDYVLPDNCEIVSEQKSAWSEEDEKMLADACIMLDWYQGNNWWKAQHIKNWLKSLKQRIGG